MAIWCPKAHFRLMRDGQWLWCLEVKLRIEPPSGSGSALFNSSPWEFLFSYSFHQQQPLFPSWGAVSSRLARSDSDKTNFFLNIRILSRLPWTSASLCWVIAYWYYLLVRCQQEHHSPCPSVCSSQRPKLPPWRKTPAHFHLKKNI